MATKREYAISLKLAKPGKGRMSRAAHDAINEAIANGMVFDEPMIAEKKAKAPVERKAPVIKAPSKDTYDPKEVRAWAIKMGLVEKGKRGKLPTSVILQFQSTNGAVPKKKIVRLPAAKVRNETVGYTYVKRGPKDPQHISEPLVAVTSCGRCTQGISTCKCSDGPSAPKYLGGSILLLTRP